MERDLLKTRRRRQVFPNKCIFWVVFKNFILFIQNNLLKRATALCIVSKEKRELCMPLLESATDFIKTWCHV